MSLESCFAVFDCINFIRDFQKGHVSYFRDSYIIKNFSKQTFLENNKQS